MNPIKTEYKHNDRRPVFCFFGFRKHCLLKSFLASLLIHIVSSGAFFYFIKEEKNRILVQKSQKKTLIPIYSSLKPIIKPKKGKVVDQLDFNQKIPKQHTPYLSRQDHSVEKETQTMMKNLFFVENTHYHPSSSKPQEKDILSKKEDEKQKQKNLSQKESIDKKGIANLNLKSKKELLRELSSLNPRLREKVMFMLKDESSKKISLFSDSSSSSLLGNQSKDNEKEKRRNYSIIGHLPGVELDVRTALNTFSEFPFFSFISRLREQVALRWVEYLLNNHSISKIEDQIYPGLSFSTLLWVKLSPDGEMLDLQILKSSGEESLDMAALNSFLATGFFPNPPPALIGPEGVIDIFQGFIVSFR